MGHGFRSVLAIRDFRSLLMATTMSQFGDRITHMLLIAVIAMSNPGRLLGYSQGALIFTVPTLLLAPLAGVLVDRWNKRNVLARTHFLQAGLFVAAAVLTRLTGSTTVLWTVFFVFFGLDLLNNTATPALLPTLVGPDRILVANSASLVFARVATVAGMILGGFLIRWVGWEIGLLANSATHLAAGLFALTIIASGPRTGRREPELTHALRSAVGRFSGELREVIRLVGRDRMVAFVMGSVIVSTFISAVSYTILIFIVQQVLGFGTAGVGIFAGIVAVGMIGGAVLMGLTRRDIDRPAVVAGSVLVYGVLFLFAPVLISPLFMALVALIAGAVFSWLGIIQNTLLQEKIAPDIRARIFSVREFIINATFIVTTLLVGAIGDLTSWRVELPVIGGVLVALGLLALPVVRRLKRTT